METDELGMAEWFAVLLFWQAEEEEEDKVVSSSALRDERRRCGQMSPVRVVLGGASILLHIASGAFWKRSLVAAAAAAEECEFPLEMTSASKDKPSDEFDDDAEAVLAGGGFEKADEGGIILPTAPDLL